MSDTTLSKANYGGAKTLDPLKLNLHETSLIEASAGTGKTFTIAMLYVRLILNHGQQAGFGRPLLPEEILVVTFTKAATQELRERIRQRLLQAAHYFAALDKASVSSDEDPLLHALCSSYTTPKARQQASQYLLLAAETMDTAAISTIHAWCGRLLNEFALLFRGGFSTHHIESETQLIKTVTQDFWRKYVLTMSAESLTYMMQQFPTPSDLAKALVNIQQSTLITLDPVADLDTTIKRIQRANQATIKQLKQDLGQHIDALEAWFAMAEEQKWYKNFNKNHKQNALDNIRAYINSKNERLVFKVSEQKLAFLNNAIWTDKAELPSNFAPAQSLANVHKKQQELDNNTPMQAVLTFAAYKSKQLINQYKQNQGVMGHNDLLDNVYHGLTDLQNTNQKALVQAIKSRFPMVMVDEFQDTDAVQYGIFKAIYGLSETSCESNTIGVSSASGFIMIGDPKQAIYSFRGGDIHTYLQAKKDVGHGVYNLSSNFRSDANLVGAVNNFFSQAEQCAGGQGAFRLGNAITGVDPIPYIQVKPGLKKRLYVQTHKQQQAALLCWLIPSDQSKTKKAQGTESYVQASAQRAADEIATLLNLAQQGNARLVTEYETDNMPSASYQTLAPRHIAILVDDKIQAQAMRKALEDRAIASVYLSDKNSVYATPIAQTLLNLLRAICFPEDSHLVSVALATNLLSLDLAALDRLQQHEDMWYQQIVMLKEYQDVWRYRGIHALVYQIIFDHQLVQYFSQLAGGERQLSDLLHLAELLQQNSRSMQGEANLIHYLETNIDHYESHEANQQRLESDRHLIQIVTVHKAKGLEYPVVFVPFVCVAKDPNKKIKNYIINTNEQGEQQVVFNPDDKAKQQYRQAAINENIRKLYVAMTRASHCLYMGLGDTTSLSLSGLGASLGIVKGHSVQEAMQPLMNTCTLLQWLPELKTRRYEPLALAPDQIRPARQLPSLHLTPWHISSYSSLEFDAYISKQSTQTNSVSTAMDIPTTNALVNTSRVDDIPPSAPATANEAILQDEPVWHLYTPVPVYQYSMHNLPRGAVYGTMLHDLLEWAADYGFARCVQDNQIRQARVKATLQALQLHAWTSAVDQWLCQFIQMPFTPDALPNLCQDSHNKFCLMDIPPNQLMAEMEFTLSAARIDVTHIDKLICQYVWPGQARASVKPQNINGLFKGFIDLVLLHNSQYFIVDWKSNYLGDTDVSYDQSTLLKGLLDKRYDVQYVLYLVALHRLLQWRVPNYDYDLHVGGAIYAFLRGSQHPDTRGLLVDKPPKQLIEKLDCLFKGQSLTSKAVGI